MSDKRVDAPRFMVGDLVEIIPAVAGSLEESTGKVVGILLDPNTRSMDKYTVRFPSSEEHFAFWDVELRREALSSVV